MKKLIIQIPCYNEEATLGIALGALPRRVPGVDVVEWQIIDDGCVDKTVEVARAHGVDHVVSLPHHQGLAKGFLAGLDAALKAGADVIVNTDADNQYNADDIPKLVAPILNGEAQIVVGERPILEIEHFSPVKKVLQRLGSWVVRVASNTDVPDAPSGFRAISREAALQLNVFNDYTYTLETIIQAGQKGIPITSVPIRTNAFLRPSRLFKSMRAYITRSLTTIVRIFVVYRPQRFFLTLGAFPMAIGVLLLLRWIIFILPIPGATHTPSLVIASIFIGGGLQLWFLGFIADLLSVNRRLLEDIQLRTRRAELDAAQRLQEQRVQPQRAL